VIKQTEEKEQELTPTKPPKLRRSVSFNDTIQVKEYKLYSPSVEIRATQTKQSKEAGPHRQPTGRTKQGQIGWEDLTVEERREVVMQLKNFKAAKGRKRMSLPLGGRKGRRNQRTKIQK